MSKPFANLDKHTIDEQIEQILHTSPEQQGKEDKRCLQDLQYLYRKEEILARVQQRVLFPNQPVPATPSIEQPEAANTAWQERNTTLSQPYSTRKKQTWPKIAASLAAALLLIGAIIGTTQFFHAPLQTTPGTGHKGSHTTATTTTVSNVVFSDPLNQNIHSWPTGKQEVFKDGAYHIINQNNNSVAAVVQQNFTQPTLSYQITVEQISSDDTDPTNTFGVILRYNSQNTNGKTVTTFYSFEILNNNVNSQYRFYKYDSSQTLPWGKKPLWTAKPGKEFHGGHGQNAVNIVKVLANGSNFTFFVNGQQVGTAQDSSFASGQMGMVVNLKGTEVAFSNLLITRP